MTADLKSRAEVALGDSWDLTRIYPNDDEWRNDFEAWKQKAKRVESFRGKLSDVENLVEYFEFDEEINRQGDRLGVYAFLKSTEDLAATTYQELKSAFTLAAGKIAEAESFVRPELLSLSDATLKALLEDERLAPWKLVLERIIRFKPHTLSESEERLVASLTGIVDVPSKAFRLLSDAETVFQPVEDEHGETKPLTHETFQLFLQSPSREVRKSAFDHFYAEYESKQNTFAALLEGSIRKDAFYAKSRGFKNSLDAAMFAEEAPETVYSNLTTTVRAALPSLYRYYELRRKLMGLDEIHFYDVYVPILTDVKVNNSWDDAVALIREALAPLGQEYVSTLTKGLLEDRWADKYENLNKESGAFSCPGYDFPPYILMNYKPTAIESVFTLAHEGGHSMHSWYSARTQPYRYYDYVIFLAEIASTFNEQLLARYLLRTAQDDRMRSWIINRELDSFRATLFRQTMFAEFEYRTHELAEDDQPLSAATFRAIYRDILNEYFGPDFTIDQSLEFECLRIPHFYRGYYVYKYATGLSAAVSLADRVLSGGEREREDYLGFLKAGCSAPPLDILRAAGVDMERPEPIEIALARFNSLVDELERLLA